MSLAILLGLAGCATAPIPMVQTPLRTAAEITRFQLVGRLQVRSGERNAVVGVDWEHSETRDVWLFTGPLGQGLARIESDQGGARMTLVDGRRADAPTAAELAESVLGVSAPFAELPRWATGRPRPDAELRATDALGRPGRIVDRGWTIDYLEYMGDLSGDLPRKIDVHQGDTRLRLIVDAWNP